jgi:hypothetical protein
LRWARDSGGGVVVCCDCGGVVVTRYAREKWFDIGHEVKERHAERDNSLTISVENNQSIELDDL